MLKFVIDYETHDFSMSRCLCEQLGVGHLFLMHDLEFVNNLVDVLDARLINGIYSPVI